MRQNHIVDKTEILAVQSVTEIIAMCPLLTPNIDFNDKTPMTDGHVDVYGDARHSNETLVGRVPVQVKGRSSGSTKKVATFPIDQNTLRFFRQNGGGVYFLVRVRKDLSRTVFYALLSPFKINRLLENAPKNKKLPVGLQTMPSEPEKVQRLFQLAMEQQKQGKVEGADEHILEQLKRITIHTVDEISADRPTSFRLEHDDFAVTIETESGLILPFDMDLEVFPSSFIPREVDITVKCGSAAYSRPTVSTEADETLNIRLSPGLGLRARKDGPHMKANIDLTLVGSLRQQVKDLDFFLSAVDGSPLSIGGTEHVAEMNAFPRKSEVADARARIGRIVDLLDELQVDEELLGSVIWTEEDLRILTTLYRGIVLGEEVGGTVNGYGRLDVNVGRFKVVTMVSQGSDPDHLRLVNPFDPAKRDKFKLYHQTDEGAMEEMTDGTVFETLREADFATSLNIPVAAMVEAYNALENRAIASALANQMVLSLLKASDNLQGAERARLVNASVTISDWLVKHGDDKAVYRINSWQARKRLGLLTITDFDEIRRERHFVFRDESDNARMREACLSILLDDRDELAVTMEGLSATQIENLQSWPIWALTQQEVPAVTDTTTGVDATN